jgi:hypothetical protein
MSDFVNLPSDGDCLHFNGRDDEESRNLEEHEAGMGKGGASSSGVGGRGHELLMCHRKRKMCCRVERVVVQFG